MKNADWNSIIKSKDFTDYLNNEELIQLSMSSHKIRKYYSKDIIKCFNFSAFVDSRGYKSTVIAEKYNNYGDLFYNLLNPYIPLTSDLTESKNQFVQDMKIFSKDLKKIIIHNSIDYSYLLYEIPEIFPKIKTLVITNSVLTIELLQHLFNNLKNLESLEICENIFIHPNEDINDYTIEWPTYLTSFKLCGNMIINTKDSYSKLVLRQVQYIDSETIELYSPPKLFPKLTTFEYKLSFNYLDNREDQIPFFHLNTQLKTLRLSGEVFNYDILSIIEDTQNLTQLEFNCEDYCDTDDYYIPILPSINHLCVIDDVNCAYERSEMFPNVVDLVIEYKYINYLHRFQDAIENYPKLKSLKLISNVCSEEIFDLAIAEVSCLEKLEINFNYDDIKFENIKLDVTACNKLKFITFTKNETSAPFENSKHIEKLFKGWNYLYFLRKLSFSKKI
jgi:hypothetical protein